MNSFFNWYTTDLETSLPLSDSLKRQWNEMECFQEAFYTNWVVSLGPNVNGFEEGLKQFVGGDKEMGLL